MITFIITTILILLMIGVIIIVGLSAPAIIIGFLLIGPFLMLDILAFKNLFGGGKKKK